jgi:hypothetical protein
MAAPINNAGAGGRPKGVPNKDTKDIREKFQMLVEGNLEQLQSDFDSLKPAERVKYTLELAKFCLPTLKSIDYQGEVKITERPKIEFIDNDSV